MKKPKTIVLKVQHMIEIEEKCMNCGHEFTAMVEGHDSEFALPTTEVECPNCHDKWFA